MWKAPHQHRFKDFVLLVIHTWGVFPGRGWFVEDCRGFLSETCPTVSTVNWGPWRRRRRIAPESEARAVDFPRACRHGLRPAQRLPLVAVETDLPRAVSVRAGCACSSGSGHLQRRGTNSLVYFRIKSDIARIYEPSFCKSGHFSIKSI